ncbi:MAG: chorismate mutase [Gemmatimonadaceae bacterium]
MNGSSDDSPPTDALARFRDEIEQIDDEIVALITRRMALGKQTGQIKRDANLPIQDPEREAAVIRHVAEVARQAGLPVEPVREVFWQIVAMSRRAQEFE